MCTGLTNQDNQSQGRQDDAMHYLHIDIETRSSQDLAAVGVYKYAESKDFKILLFGYSMDEGEVQVVDLANGEKIPAHILAALSDQRVIKWAHNASFERVCLSRFLGLPAGTYLDPSSWRCTMVRAATLGLPLSLAAIGRELWLDKQKLEEGKDLIKLFSLPAKAEGESDCFNRPMDYPEEWTAFRAYNKRDVEVEMEIGRRLARYDEPPGLWQEYQLDQRINDLGIAIDVELAESASYLKDKSEAAVLRRLKSLTGLANPNSTAQMKEWLASQGILTDSLAKSKMAELVKTAPPKVVKVLQLKRLLGMTSLKKYDTMLKAMCADGRARGMFQFYGAIRTGRFAGRLIQLHNLPKNHLEDLEGAREAVRAGDYEFIEAEYGSVQEVLSELVRTALVPKRGSKFIVADFSSIEARILSWLAGESWRMELFAAGGDIYCACAERMFHCHVEKDGENSELRQKGKQAELACGYGGSVGALERMGALEAGMKPEELKPLVDAWREANPHIVNLWWLVQKAILRAVERPDEEQMVCGLSICFTGALMQIRLPSGRRLSYLQPRLEYNRFGSRAVTYMGSDGANRWTRVESYGAKFVENIVQGIARDILLLAMERLAQKYDIVAHVHDEVVLEVSAEVKVETVCAEMSEAPDWAEGLNLAADGFETLFYRK